MELDEWFDLLEWLCRKFEVNNFFWYFCYGWNCKTVLSERQPSCIIKKRRFILMRHLSCHSTWHLILRALPQDEKGAQWSTYWQSQWRLCCCWLLSGHPRHQLHKERVCVLHDCWTTGENVSYIWLLLPLAINLSVTPRISTCQIRRRLNVD